MKKVRITYIQDGIEKIVGKYRFNFLAKYEERIYLETTKNTDSLCIENMTFDRPTEFSCMNEKTKIIFKDCEFTTDCVKLYDGYYQLVRPKFTSPRTRVTVDAKGFEMNLLRDRNTNLDATIRAGDITITNSKSDDYYNLSGKNVSLIKGEIPQWIAMRTTQLYLNGLVGNDCSAIVNTKSLTIENSQLRIGGYLDCTYQQIGLINSKIRIGNHSKINGIKIPKEVLEIEITPDNIERLTAESNLLKVLKEVRLQATKAQEHEKEEKINPYEVKIEKEKATIKQQYRNNRQRLDNKLEAIRTEVNYQVGKMKVKELLPGKKS